MSNFIGKFPGLQYPYNCKLNLDPAYKRDCMGDTSTNVTTGIGESKSSEYLENTFNFYRNKIPVTIPSTVSPLEPDSYTKNIPDKTIIPYFISTPEYSDSTLNNANGSNTSRLTSIDGFTNALSKCIEYNGSPYPLCTPTSTPSVTCSLSENDLKYKPNCYAVTVQSDYTGHKLTDDTVAHTFNYKLVELPTASKIDVLSKTIKFKKFISGKQVDKNFLVCQPQFYTWVKNDKSNTIIHNQYAPNYKETPSNSPTPTIRGCPSESYPDLTAPPEADPNNGAPVDFWTPRERRKPPFVAPPLAKKKDNKTVIIIGVISGIIVVGGLIYYFYPKDSSDSVSTVTSAVLPIPATPALNITKTKGGYFYY